MNPTHGLRPAFAVLVLFAALLAPAREARACSGMTFSSLTSTPVAPGATFQMTIAGSAGTNHKYTYLHTVPGSPAYVFVAKAACSQSGDTITCTLPLNAVPGTVYIADVWFDAMPSVCSIQSTPRQLTVAAPAPALTALSVSAGTLTPAFAAGTTSYTLTVPGSVSSLSVTATANAGTSSLTIAGVAATSGSPSTVALPMGTTSIAIALGGAAGSATYTLNVTRPGTALELAHEGFLIDGADVPANGSVPMTFRILDAATGGAELWSSGACPVAVKGGYYGVLLGAGCGSGLYSDRVPAGATRWLEVSVGGLALTPRARLAGAPVAVDAANLGGLPASSYVQFDASGRLPAVDGSRLTNLATSQVGGLGLLAAKSTIADADVASAAAIAGTKIAPNFGAQNVVTTGSAGIGTTSPAYRLDVRGGDINTDGSLREAGTALSTKYALAGGSNATGTWPISITGSVGASQITAGTFPSGSFSFQGGLGLPGGAWTAGGRLGIGSTTPAVSLDLTGRTDAIAIPSGTTAQRPATAGVGYLRFNTTTNALEVFSGATWLTLAATAVTNGLVAEYAFEGSGADTSGGSKSLGAVGSPVIASAGGKIGSYLQMSSASGMSANRYERTNDLATADGARSVSAWIQHAGAASEGGWWTFDGAPRNTTHTNGTAWFFHYRSGSYEVLSHGNDHSFGVTETQFNTWHHVVVTYAAGVLKFYKNCALLYNQSGKVFNTSASAFMVGGSWSKNDLPTSGGKVDQVRVYNREISASEVTALYNSGSGL